MVLFKYLCFTKCQLVKIYTLEKTKGRLPYVSSLLSWNAVLTLACLWVDKIALFFQRPFYLVFCVVSKEAYRWIPFAMLTKPSVSSARLHASVTRRLLRHLCLSRCLWLRPLENGQIWQLHLALPYSVESSYTLVIIQLKYCLVLNK